MGMTVNEPFRKKGGGGGGIQQSTKELVELVSGSQVQNTLSLNNGIAKAATDTPTEQHWLGARTTADGGAIRDGVAFVNKVSGESLKVVQKRYRYENNNVNTEEYGDIVTITPLSSGGRYILRSLDEQQSRYTNVISGHKYLQSIVIRSINGKSVGFQNYGGGLGQNNNKTNSQTFVSLYKIAIATSDSASVVQISSAVENESFQIKKDSFQLFDLTLMGMEDVTTADDLAQRFGYKTYMDMPPFPYTDGSIINTKVESIKSESRNLWDEEWELGNISSIGINSDSTTRIRSANYIEIKQFKELYFKIPKTIGLRFYDENKNFISSASVNSSRLLTIDNNSSYIRFVVVDENTYNHDICINVPDELNGTYTPYMQPDTLPLILSDIKDADGNELFPDGLCGIGDVKDDVDFDNGRAVKRIGKVDLGSLSWRVNSAYFVCDFSKHRYVDNDIACVFLNMRYEPIEIKHMSININKRIAGTTLYIYVRDDNFDNVSDFKESLKGVMLLYELRKPIEVTFAPRKAYYKVQAYGIETAQSTELSAPLTAEIGYRGGETANALNLL